MVNETSGENLLELSKKMLNEALGPKENDTEETLLPKVEINAPPPQEQETSSDLVPSIETKNSSISDDTKDISINSKEDTVEAPLRSPGFVEMRLKRKSNMGPEEDDSNYSEDSQPVTDELHIETDNPS